MNTCTMCNTEMVMRGPDRTASYENDGICMDCFANNYFNCSNCAHTIHNDDAYHYEGEAYCQECYDREREDEDEEQMPRFYRAYSALDLPEFQSRSKGNIITSQRKFSAEIECYPSSSRALQEVSTELSRAIGITEDGSLSDDGVELQTPKLRGGKGEEALRKICTVLNKHNFTVDEHAGLHIHLDGAGLLTKKQNSPVRDLFLYYMRIEEVLLSFLPHDRRSNGYCYPLHTRYSMFQIGKCKTLAQIEQAWYRTNDADTIKIHKRHQKDGSRYVGINFHSLLAQGHLEIRFHSGTLHPVKMLEWINLHQRIMDQAVAGTLTLTPLTGSKEEKTRQVFAELALSTTSAAYFLKRQKKFHVSGETKETDLANIEVIAGAENTASIA